MHKWQHLKIKVRRGTSLLFWFGILETKNLIYFSCYKMLKKKRKYHLKMSPKIFVTSHSSFVHDNRQISGWMLSLRYQRTIKLIEWSTQTRNHLGVWRVVVKKWQASMEILPKMRTCFLEAWKDRMSVDTRHFCLSCASMPELCTCIYLVFTPLLSEHLWWESCPYLWS